MRFSADEMLGKLARWLRMNGWDVLYKKQINDDELIETAKKEKRIILTRDNKIINRLQKDAYLFIHHDHLEDQFQEVYSNFPQMSSHENPFSRCVECNTMLESIEKEKIKDKVWPYVYQTQENFTTCPSCNRIYWQATHIKKIKEKLEKLTLIK